MGRRLARSAVCTALLCAVFQSPARAALFGDDEARRAILELRAQVLAQRADLERLIQAANDKADNKMDRQAALTLATQNEQLRQELAALRGQVEVLLNNLNTVRQQQRDLYQNIDERIRTMEPQAVTIDGEEVSASAVEKRVYDGLLNRLHARDFAGTAAMAREFIAAHPHSELRPHVQYMLGSAYYGQRQCKLAVSTHSELVARFGDHPRAADALLNIASCQIEEKDRDSARKTFRRIMSKYPGSDAAASAEERLAALK